MNTKFKPQIKAGTGGRKNQEKVERKPILVMRFEKTNPIFLKTIGVYSCEFVANLKKQSQFTKWYMNVSSFTTRYYGAKMQRRDGKNKANQSQFCLRRELMKQF